MQTASPQLIAASTGWPRTPLYKLEVCWDDVHWTDETAYLLEMSGSSEGGALGVGPSALGSSLADTLSFTLDNRDRRYSVYDYGGYGKQVRAKVGMQGAADLCQQMIGHLTAPREIPGLEATVSYDALSLASRAAGKRVSTALQVNKRADEYITMLAGMLDPNLVVIPDTGLDVYPFLWSDDEPIWEEMVRVAEAEGGRVFIDKDGNLRFWNFLHLLQNGSPVATFTGASTDYTDLEPEWDFSNIYNKVIVKYRPRFIAGIQSIWQSSEAIAVPPASDKLVWAQFQSPAYQIVTPEAKTDYSARTASHIDKTSNVTVSVVAAYAQRAQLRLRNSNAVHQVYVDGLQLRGYPLLVTEERTAEAADDGAGGSIETYGERVWEMDNVYIQSEEQAASLAQSILHRFKLPRRTVRLRNVRGLPYLEVGDRVHVDDTPNTDIDGDFFVAAIDWRAERRLFWHDLTLVDAASIYPYSNYFQVGATALGAAGRAYH